MPSAGAKRGLFKADWRRLQIAPPHMKSRGSDSYKWMEARPSQLSLMPRTTTRTWSAAWRRKTSRRRLFEVTLQVLHGGPSLLLVHKQRAVRCRFWGIVAHAQEISDYYDEENVDSLPYTVRGYSYYTRQKEEDYLPVFCRKREGSDAEEVILNLNTEFAQGQERPSLLIA